METSHESPADFADRKRRELDAVAVALDVFYEGSRRIPLDASVADAYAALHAIRVRLEGWKGGGS